MKDRVHLSYDDVLVEPQSSSVRSRDDPSTHTAIVNGIGREVPIISASMDTVTNGTMAQAMSDCGATGIIHRFHGDKTEQTEHQRIQLQAHDVAQVDGFVGAAVGIDGKYVARGTAIQEAGADFVCVDIAHGHMDSCVEAVSMLSDSLSVPIMAGNVATADATDALIRAGADSVKVGIGPGSHCLTRDVAGVGVPQISAIRNAVQGRSTAGQMVPLVADGGIQQSGDIVKALVAGADSVMIGGQLAGCTESAAPTVEIDGTKYNRTHGMASEEAREEHGLPNEQAAEGASGYTQHTGPVVETIEELTAGLRTGLSYCGGHTIEEARENAELIRVSGRAASRSGTHGSYNTE